MELFMGFVLGLAAAPIWRYAQKLLFDEENPFIPAALSPTPPTASPYVPPSATLATVAASATAAKKSPAKKTGKTPSSSAVKTKAASPAKSAAKKTAEKKPTAVKKKTPSTGATGPEAYGERVIGALQQSANGMSLAEIGQVLDVQYQTLIGPVRQMVKDGRVNKEDKTYRLSA